jgi:16S rRNA processing protein RimM
MPLDDMMSPTGPDSTGPDSKAQRVCVGEIAGAHGVRGLVRLISFTADPADVASYGPLEDEAGRRRFQVTLKGQVRGQWIAAVDGVADRDAADRLKRTRLYVARDRLAAIKDADEFYQADLIGLAAERQDGTPYGTVRAVHDFGAGDMLEIALETSQTTGTVYLPFTRAVVPVIDVAGGRVVVDPPAEVIAREGDES